jgi:hypothetical protein
MAQPVSTVETRAAAVPGLKGARERSGAAEFRHAACNGRLANSTKQP